MKRNLILTLALTLGLVRAATAADDVFYTASAGPAANPDSVQGSDVWVVVANNGGSYLAGTPAGWAVWGNGDHLETTATHTLAGGALTNGQTISIKYAHGSNIDTGQRVGVRLLDASDTVQAEFSFLGGGTAFQKYDTGSGTYVDTAKGYDNGHLFTLNYVIGAGGTAYTASATVGSTGGGGSDSWSGTVVNPIAKIQIFTAGGWNSDQYFNNFQVSSAGVCPTISMGNITANPLKNAPYSFAFVAAGGVAPYTYAVTNGSLPAGLSLSSGGVLSGTPATNGTSTFTVKATDTNGCTGSRTYTLRVYASGVDDSSNYGAWTGNGGSGFGAWSFYNNNHGSGFAGAERNTGNGDANIQVADTSIWKLYAVNFETNQQWVESIVYRAISSPLMVSNDLFSVSMEMQNGGGGLGNPGQMGFALRNGNTTGSSNQTAGARLAVYLAGGSNNVVVTDAAGTYEMSVTNGGLGAAYDFTVRLTSGNTYELTIIRYTNVAGATAAPVTVTGTLAGSGSIDSFSLFNWKNSTNSGCNSDAFFNRVAYSAANFVCPTIVLKSLTGGLLGTAYTNNVSAAAGVPPYSYSVTAGSLPAGLSLSSGGVLSGTPASSGESTFTVTATDANNCTGSRAYTFTVHGTGADDAENYGAWNGGDNAGAGFGAWSFYADNHGSDFVGHSLIAGSPNIAGPGGQTWKLYAINFSNNLQQEESTAYRKFTAPLSVAGDEFTMSFLNGSIGNPGQVGFALRNGYITGGNSSITNGSNNRAARARLQVYFAGGTGNLTVEDASGANQITGVGYTTFGYGVKVTLTSPDTYSLTITRYNGIGTFGAPVTVTGTLAGSGPIDSFSMFTWKNSTESGVNGDSYFSNLGYTSGTTLITNNVSFQVDMTAQLFIGNFDPSTDTVEVRGSFNGWVGGAYVLTNNPSGPNTNLYSGVVPIVGAPGSGESYKFVYTNLANGAVYENSTPKVYTQDTGANDYNRFFQLPNTSATVLPSVFFNDKNLGDYLPADISVTFTVDMNGAVGTDAHVFDASSGDTVWVNSQFIPWYPWWGGVNPVPAPVQFQMIEMSPGGGIYSNTVIVPKGTPVAFTYKYGIGIGGAGDLGPRDNEAAVGQDHYRVVRSTATGFYTMALDKFGVQYHEPLFSPQAKADSQLTIGAPSGGTIPVRWLGRPGAHLQSATSVAGPWTDHMNTDGTNWSSGVGSTNGLVSVTNWSAVGKTFFRLVKP